MGVNIRKSTSADAAEWIDLFQSVIGPDYPDKSMFDPNWVSEQLGDGEGSHPTWVAEEHGHLLASISVLQGDLDNLNPVINLGRNLFTTESYSNNAAVSLIKHTQNISASTDKLIVVRVPMCDNSQQLLFEGLGFVCAGFQPFKHVLNVREGVLFYVKPAGAEKVARIPVSESLPHVSELAQTVLETFKYPRPSSIRDGATGYPLQSELDIRRGPGSEFHDARTSILDSNPPVEFSGGFNRGHGYMRNDTLKDYSALLGYVDNQVVAAIAYLHDEQDRCVRILDGFSVDDLSLGPLCYNLVQISQEELSGVYLEADVLMTAPRLLKSMEQLGFVPVTYLPAIYAHGDLHSDVVKLVKLNMLYSLETPKATSQASKIIKIVDQNFQDQKIGLAIINLLRGLPIFNGLGDGELRKIARLFKQKLFRPQEVIFNKGDSGEQAFVIMRGQVDILLSDNASPIAQISNGQIFGELAFLDGAARTAMAKANQACILLVVNRSEFNDMVKREPHLGMVIMRNIAMELSDRLRKTNAVLTSQK